ncbi:MAG TPA: dTDP-4-dehydrorhamnose 3,5-epimerase [Proteobacteria bacterium]|nr:dTDP-4-dehydrorhamnose 3,5-epimerase [Pseudomonadota bacterium]
MEFVAGAIAGVVLVRPDIHCDQRGFFMETFNQEKYHGKVEPCRFVQDNMSSSLQGTVRGLHYQLKKPQGKLVFALRGEIFDVAVDIRYGSPTFGLWVGYHLSENNRWQLFVPPGLAHGFMVLSDKAEVYYKCTNVYSPGDEYGLLWNDPDIGIDWPLAEVIISEKDRLQPTLAGIDQRVLPLWSE